MRKLIPALAPETLVVTGDLTHRGRRPELELARELLESLALPVLAVPGNHDIPYVFPTRFTRTRAEWERVFGTTEPAYTSERLAIVGLELGPSVASAGWGGRTIPTRPPRVTARACAGGRAAGRGASPPPRIATLAALPQTPAAPADFALQRLASTGAELVLGGHVHQSSVAERREFEAVEHDGLPTLVFLDGAGFGRPRPQRRGEAVGFNTYAFDGESITVVTWSWSGHTFAEVGRRAFQRRHSRRDEADLPSTSA